jgi:hypothetical protein
LPQEPLFPIPAARRAPRLRPVRHPLPATTGAPVRIAIARPADDPPHGRVLLVHDDAGVALRLQRLLGELGWRVLGPAASLDEVERLLTRPQPGALPIDCALVAAGLPDSAAVAERLADDGIGLVWLADGAATLPASFAHAPVLDWPLDGPRDRAALRAALEEARRLDRGRSCYPVPPPQAAWPRVFPQL